MTTHLHRVLSDPDRIRVLDHIAASVEPVTGRQIATSMNVSELWVSRYLNQMADVGLTLRVYVYEGVERVKPWGSYSMAPIVSADKVAA